MREHIEVLNKIKSEYAAECSDCCDCGDCDVKSICFDFSAIQALNLAIKALEQESCEDSISRKWVLNKIHVYAEADTTSTEESIGADYCAEFVEDAPSVVPSSIGSKRGEVGEDGCYPYCVCNKCGSMCGIQNNGWCNYGARMESKE